ncbi:MAG: ATP-binding protein [Candidatus Eisenbacteria bacterium]|nr:ATP-binding protein [Candidatus Eisenbacteria bacterium]
MTNRAALHPFPNRPADPDVPPPEDRRARTILLLAIIPLVALIDYLSGTDYHYIQLLMLVPILAAMLAGPMTTVVLTGICVVVTIVTGLLRGEPLSNLHLPAALGMVAAGAVGTWVASREREILSNARQRDIEHRRDLSESLSLLMATLESTADGILVVDQHQRVSSVNGRFAEIWGISADLLHERRDEALVGAVLSQLVDPVAFQNRVRELYEHPADESFETLLFRDGRIVERYSRPQRIGERIVGRVWSFRDVTKSRRAEQAIEESLQRVDRLLSTSPAVLFSFRPEIPFEATFLSSNVVDQLGFESGRFLADPHLWKHLLAEEDLESHRGWREQLLVTGHTGDVLRFRHRDGRLRSLSIELRVLSGPGGQPTEIVGSSIDVTDRLESEAERNRLLAMLAQSEAMSAIGGLVGGVAHEVRNPLFTISASLDAFEARFGARPEYQSYLGALRGSVVRLSRLMNQLLDYGKPPRIDLELTSLHECVERAIELLPAPLRDLGVVIENRVPEDLPRFLLDGHMILQVFQNLIENAVQHSPAGGRVVVGAVPAARDGRDGVTAHVDDSGPGFNPGPISRIFEPFVSERYGGTGLGLSIVRRIVELHGGQIEAGNRPEGGAKVLLWFPTSPAAVAAGELIMEGAHVSTSHPAG